MVVQSYATGMADLLGIVLKEFVAEQFWGVINLSLLNSSKVMSEYSLIP